MKKKKITKAFMLAMASVNWIVIVDPYNFMRCQPSTDAGNMQCNFIRSFHIICILKDSLFVDLLNIINLYYQGKTSPSSSGRMYVNRAQEVVTSMLARGSAIRQEAVSKAKAFDEKHQFTASASAKVISFDRRVGLTEKLTVGISVVNEKVKSVDQRLHMSDKTMAAIFAAERKINDTGSAVKTSRY